MPAKPRIVDKDLGFKEILASLERMKRMDITVGIHSDVRPYRGENGDEGPNVAEIYAIHEMGLGHNPARATMTPTFDSRVEHYRKFIANLYRQAALGKMTADVACERLGMQVQADVRKAVQQITEPPLKRATVRARERRLKTFDNKKHGPLDKPLIDSGHMIGAISYKVNGAGEPPEE